MVFTHLKLQYQDMQNKGQKINKFNVNVRSHQFSCMFLADDEGKVLFISGIGEKAFTISLTIKADFSWSGYLGENYSKLCEYLELHYDPKNRFNPSQFFEEMNSKFPVIFVEAPSLSQRANVIYNYSNTKPKPYFKGWIHWTIKEPSEENYELTASLVGFSNAKRLKAAQISSAWSSNPDEEDLSKLDEWVAMVENRAF